VFGKRVLRRIFGSEREEVTGGWRKLHEKLHNFWVVTLCRPAGRNNIVTLLHSCSLTASEFITLFLSR
jgi:hypothetical protein